MVDTLSNGFTVSRTLWRRLLPVSPPHAHTVDQVTLLGLVSQSPRLVRSGGSARTVDNGELSVLPASDSGDELQDVRLLFGVELLEVFVGTHLVCQNTLQAVTMRLEARLIEESVRSWTHLDSPRVYLMVRGFLENLEDEQAGRKQIHRGSKSRAARVAVRLRA